MIGAIIVLYNPDFELLKNGLDALLPQIDKICLIDNSSVDNSHKIPLCDKINYIPLMENKGIAIAQNIGIRYFEKAGFEYVVFSDQDSVATENVVSSLAQNYESLSKSYNIAAIGPQPINRKTQKSYVKKSIIKETIENNGKSYYKVYSIVSSFSLVKLSTFSVVGYMEEELFIDGVDDEWCWRAHDKAKLDTFVVCDLQFSHFQGCDESVSYKKSTPFRSYYQFRNFIRLLNRRYVPKYWKCMNLVKFSVKTFYYPLFVAPRKEYIKAIFAGIKDGIRTIKQ